MIAMFRLLLFIALGLASTASVNLRAQTRTRVDDELLENGWTYVASIDWQHFTIRPYGDTLIVDCYKGDSILRQAVRLLSLNGGKTFDTIPYPDAPTNWRLDSRYISTFTGSAPIISLQWSDTSTKDSFGISTDLGRTYRYGLTSSLPKGWVPNSDDSSVWMFDSVSHYYVGGSTYPLHTLFRSTDTGKTWTQISDCPDCQLPGIPPGFEGLSLYYIYDVRQHGLWYVSYNPSGDPGATTGLMYRTTDNGASFEQACIAPGYPFEWVAGIGSVGELRESWNGNIPRGYLFYDSACNSQIVDWIDSLLPGRPDTLMYNLFGMYSGINDQGYSYSNIDPNYLLMPVYEAMNTPWLHAMFPDSIWTFYSTNGGKTWSVIWVEDSNIGEISGAYRQPQRFQLDNRHPSLLWTTEGPNIYRRDMNASRSANAVGQRSHFDLSIRYSNYGIEVEPPSRTRALEVVDELGRPAYQTYLSFNFSTVRIPRSKLKGVYFLIAKDQAGNILASSSLAIE